MSRMKVILIDIETSRHVYPRMEERRATVVVIDREIEPVPVPVEMPLLDLPKFAKELQEKKRALRRIRKS